MPNKTHSAAFLIRWQQDGPQGHWRSTVENAYTGQKEQFMNKNELLRHVWQLLYDGESSDPAGTPAEE